MVLVTDRPRTRRRLVAGAVVTLGLVLAGCGDGDDDAGPRATSRTTSTTAATTTSTTERPPIRPFPPVTAPLPQPGEDLAEGVHAVRITETGDDWLTVDVVQFLTGEEANVAYAEETGDTSGVPNDYYIRNSSDEVRSLGIADGAEFSVAWDGPGPGEFPVSYDELRAALAERPDSPFWITVLDGMVTAVHEQYTP